MRNPFEYGNVVEEGSFCNRKEELEKLKRVFENSERLFLYSERRLGKTSLIKVALRNLSKNKYTAVYVDLWSTNSEGEFALALAKSITESSTTATTKLLGLAKSVFGFLRPAVTTDEEGKPQVVFGVNKEDLTAPALDEVLKSIPNVAKQTKKRLIIVLDEFQQIAEYKSDTAERRLRSAIQHHQEIAYVFLGSKKQLIQKMFLDKQRPLYRSVAHYQLQPISEKHWAPFIRKKFIQTGKNIDEEVINKLCKFTDGHPFYTQHLCHALWELTETNNKVQDNMLVQAIDLLLQQEGYTFTTLWDSLSANQRVLLTAIAVALGGFKPFGTDFVKHSGIGSASNVQRAANSLIVRDLIDRNENGSFVIPDRFLKLWLYRRTVNGPQYLDSPFSYLK